MFARIRETLNKSRAQEGADLRHNQIDQLFREAVDRYNAGVAQHNAERPDQPRQPISIQTTDIDQPHTEVPHDTPDDAAAAQLAEESHGTGTAFVLDDRAADLGRLARSGVAAGVTGANQPPQVPLGTATGNPLDAALLAAAYIAPNAPTIVPEQPLAPPVLPPDGAPADGRPPLVPGQPPIVPNQPVVVAVPEAPSLPPGELKQFCLGAPMPGQDHDAEAANLALAARSRAMTMGIKPGAPLPPVVTAMATAVGGGFVIGRGHTFSGSTSKGISGSGSPRRSGSRSGIRDGSGEESLERFAAIRSRHGIMA